MTDEKETQGTGGPQGPSGAGSASEGEAATPAPEAGAAAAEAATEAVTVSVATEPQTATPPVVTEERKLVRRPENKMVAGVCTGLAAYSGVDVVIWRIAFVVLTLSTGIGLIGYIVAWIVMPMARRGDPVPPPPSDPTKLKRWAGIGLVVLGAVVLFRNTFEIRGSVFWGLLLVGIGLAFWGWELSGRNGHSESRAADPAAAAPPAPPAPATIAGGAPPPPPTVTAPAGAAVPPVPPAPPAPREPSMLGRLVVGAAALAVGIAVLLDNLGAVNVTAQWVFIILLGITALGLLVGAFWGRARWLIIPGIVLVLTLAMHDFVPNGFHGTSGELLWRPSRLSEVRRTYNHFAGEAVLDLSSVRMGERDRRVTVEQSFGEILVLVPEGFTVVVNAEVTGGELDLFGERSEGFGQIENTVRRAGDPERGTMYIDADLAFGQITVREPMPGENLIERCVGRGCIWQEPPSAGDRGFRFDVGPGPGIRIQDGDATDGRNR